MRAWWILVVLVTLPVVQGQQQCDAMGRVTDPEADQEWAGTAAGAAPPDRTGPIDWVGIEVQAGPEDVTLTAALAASPVDADRYYRYWFHLDGPDGSLVASLSIANTGSYDQAQLYADGQADSELLAEVPVTWQGPIMSLRFGWSDLGLPGPVALAHPRASSDGPFLAPIMQARETADPYTQDWAGQATSPPLVACRNQRFYDDPAAMAAAAIEGCSQRTTTFDDAHDLYDADTKEPITGPAAIDLHEVSMFADADMWVLSLRLAGPPPFGDGSETYRYGLSFEGASETRHLWMHQTADYDEAVIAGERARLVLPVRWEGNVSTVIAPSSWLDWIGLQQAPRLSLATADGPWSSAAQDELARPSPLIYDFIQHVADEWAPCEPPPRAEAQAAPAPPESALAALVLVAVARRR